jgi:hypothetical protein
MMQKFYGEEEMEMLINTGNDLDPLFNGVQNRSPVIITSQIMCFSLPSKKEICRYK